MKKTVKQRCYEMRQEGYSYDVIAATLNTSTSFVRSAEKDVHHSTLVATKMSEKRKIFDALLRDGKGIFEAGFLIDLPLQMAASWGKYEGRRLPIIEDLPLYCSDGADAAPIYAAWGFTFRLAPNEKTYRVLLPVGWEVRRVLGINRAVLFRADKSKAAAWYFDSETPKLEFNNG